MFSPDEKQYIAKKVEALLLSMNHPEMPKNKVSFKLHIDGAEDWSWADIVPNHVHDVLCEGDENGE